MIVCVLISNDDYYDGGKGCWLYVMLPFLAAKLHPHEEGECEKDGEVE